MRAFTLPMRPGPWGMRILGAMSVNTPWESVPNGGGAFSMEHAILSPSKWRVHNSTPRDDIFVLGVGALGCLSGVMGYTQDEE